MADLDHDFRRSSDHNRDDIGKRDYVRSFARNPMAVCPGSPGGLGHRPVMGDGDFYSVYYSAGVLPEAELMAVKLSVARSRPTVKTPAELS